MLHTLVRLSALLTVALGLALAPAPATADLPPMYLGPGDANVDNLGNKAVIRWSKFGYVYIAGKHNTHLTVTYNAGTHKLRYRDTRTGRLRSKPKTCDRKPAARGITVVCKVPRSFRGRTMFVQVWPRLGNDYIDARTLPRRFRLWALMDAGRDVAYGGRGRDFFNGAFDGDRIFGGRGGDKINSGKGGDVVVGGAGGDQVFCSDGYDTVYRDGRDRISSTCELVRWSSSRQAV